MHLGNALAPSFRQYERLVTSSNGNTNRTWRCIRCGPEIAGFMGLRPIKIDPLRSMGFKIC